MHFSVHLERKANYLLGRKLSTTQITKGSQSPKIVSYACVPECVY
jgi:hypothetical protein